MMSDSRGVRPVSPLPSPTPFRGVLSNGAYTVVIGPAGTGFSTLDGEALTVRRLDGLEDAGGLLVYLRDRESGSFQSFGQLPAGNPRGEAGADRCPGGFRLTGILDGIKARLEICVCAEAAAELRRVTLLNRSGRPRSLSLATGAEIALQSPVAYAAHPEFSKLFVQTEATADSRVLLARRRPRAPGERHPWLVHAVWGGNDAECETDRARFLGRGGHPRWPRALAGSAPLSGTTGNVLDPVMSLKVGVELEDGEEKAVCFVLGAAPGRSEALLLARRFTAADAVAGEFVRAGNRERALRADLRLEDAEAERLQALAAGMLYGETGLRAAPEILARARGRIGDLARHGISPGHLLVVHHAAQPGGAALTTRVLKACGYWRALGLPVRLVVLDGEPASSGLPAAAAPEEPIVIGSGAIAAAERDLLDAAAHLVIAGSLPEVAAPAGAGRDPGTLPRSFPAAGGDEPLRFFNGLGGFTESGREYVIRLRRRPDGTPALPPRPWINVVANDTIGFLVSETGAGCTWSRNSREHRLTPWSNDPLLDTPGEAFYIRDEDSGVFWSPLPAPAPGPADYEMRHGFGYSRCRHAGFGLEQETTLFVARADPVKITTIRLTNRETRARRLSITAFCRLVLGSLPEESGRFVVTGWDAPAGALLARNHLAGDFADGIAFGAVVAPPGCEGIQHTGDRAGFIGAGGSLASPAALRGVSPLDGRTGAGLDPCLAQRVVARLGPGASLEVSFLFGEVGGLDGLHDLLARYPDAGAVGRAFEEARESWARLLSGLQIATPLPELDVMVNGWLPYQTLACRILARSAFYQSGGAFGYRDQLQDAAALAVLDPGLTRNQILLHAAHQFLEGDVLHWWHPPSDRGLRTRFADDLLWLPGLTAAYIRSSGDRAILEERLPFLAARALEPGEDEAFLLPASAGESADLYEHCVRAIDRSLAFGAHGLPLFGTGDWNDGMNRVGREGRGESVWMGFFLHHVLGAFSPLCELRGDAARARRYAGHRGKLEAALNDAGWDGDWYRRGYYDDGTPLGSARNEECRIDALAQAWAVISGAAPAERARRAMDAVEEHLISDAEGLIRLLTPPFENSPQDPGYIKGYVPGVRENGGQYTHAAMWVVRAMAELGRHARAVDLLAMLNPIRHARTPEEVALYQVEPYVVAADVYGAAPHVGRGGWTWYTGSSGWMYRVAVETILGFEPVEGRFIRLRPRIPDDWPEFRIRWRAPGDETAWRIVVRNPSGRADGVVAATLDGAAVEVTGGTALIPLTRDGREHSVEVALGAG